MIRHGFKNNTDRYVKDVVLHSVLFNPILISIDIDVIGLHRALETKQKSRNWSMCSICFAPVSKSIFINSHEDMSPNCAQVVSNAWNRGFDFRAKQHVDCLQPTRSCSLWYAVAGKLPLRTSSLLASDRVRLLQRLRRCVIVGGVVPVGFDFWDGRSSGFHANRRRAAPSHGTCCNARFKRNSQTVGQS